MFQNRLLFILACSSRMDPSWEFCAPQWRNFLTVDQDEHDQSAEEFFNVDRETGEL